MLTTQQLMQGANPCPSMQMEMRHPHVYAVTRLHVTRDETAVTLNLTENPAKQVVMARQQIRVRAAVKVYRPTQVSGPAQNGMVYGRSLLLANPVAFLTDPADSGSLKPRKTVDGNEGTPGCALDGAVAAREGSQPQAGQGRDCPRSQRLRESRGIC